MTEAVNITVHGQQLVNNNNNNNKRKQQQINVHDDDNSQQQHRPFNHDQVLFKTGHPEMATMVFEDALADGVEEFNSFAAPKLDLHNHTVSTAL